MLIKEEPIPEETIKIEGDHDAVSTKSTPPSHPKSTHTPAPSAPIKFQDAEMSDYAYALVFIL